MNHHRKLNLGIDFLYPLPDVHESKITPPLAVAKRVVVDVDDIDATAYGLNNGIDDGGGHLWIPRWLYRDSWDVGVIGSNRDETSHEVDHGREGFRHKRRVVPDAIHDGGKRR